MKEKEAQTPIEDLIKQILLSNYKRKPFIDALRANLYISVTGECPAEPLSQDKVYDALMFGVGQDLDEEKIKIMTNDDLAKNLSLMETEDQDELLRFFPEREQEFWDLVGIGWELVEKDCHKTLPVDTTST